MLFPIIQVLSSVCHTLGLDSGCVGRGLTKAQQAVANRLATEYATRFYNKSVHELTMTQLKRVHDFVKEQIGK